MASYGVAKLCKKSGAYGTFKKFWKDKTIQIINSNFTPPTSQPNTKTAWYGLFWTALFRPIPLKASSYYKEKYGFEGPRQIAQPSVVLK